jgi:putative ABC transport system permease protein
MKIDLSYEEGVPAARVGALVTAMLKARHGREDFTITTQEDMLRTLSNILDVLTMAVGALGSISLLVGWCRHCHHHDHRRLGTYR